MRNVSPELLFEIYNETYALAKQGDKRELKYMLKHGGDVNAALIGGAEGGHFSIVKLACDKGAQLKTEGKDALLYAISGTQYKIAKYLIEYGGIDVNNLGDFIDEDYGIRRAANYALDTGDYRMFELMIKHGGNIHRCKEIAREAGETGNVKMLEFLHKHGFDLNEVVSSVAINGDVKLMQFISEQGADVANSRHSAIMFAAIHNHLELAKYLYKKGANISANREIALMKAAKNGHIEMFDFLRSKGADITIDDYKPLRIAMGTEIGREIVKRYHELGIDHNIIIAKLYPENDKQKLSNIITQQDCKHYQDFENCLVKETEHTRIFKTGIEPYCPTFYSTEQKKKMDVIIVSNTLFGTIEVFVSKTSSLQLNASELLKNIIEPIEGDEKVATTVAPMSEKQTMEAIEKLATNIEAVYVEKEIVESYECDVNLDHKDMEHNEIMPSEIGDNDDFEQEYSG